MKWLFPAHKPYYILKFIEKYFENNDILSLEDFHKILAVVEGRYKLQVIKDKKLFELFEKLKKEREGVGQ